MGGGVPEKGGQNGDRELLHPEVPESGVRGILTSFTGPIVFSISGTEEGGPDTTLAKSAACNPAGAASLDTQKETAAASYVKVVPH